MQSITYIPIYNLYYMSQALFQSDFEAWNRWNQVIIRRLKREQNSDGRVSIRLWQGLCDEYVGPGLGT